MNQQPLPHVGDRAPRSRADGEVSPADAPDLDQADTLKVKDATSTASKPQATLADQVSTMESEGQAQPQAGDLDAEELERQDAPKP